MTDANFEPCFNIDTKIATPSRPPQFVLFAESDMLYEHENIATFYRP